MLVVGENWDKTIGRKLDEARYFVVLLSSAAAASDMVCMEIVRAYEKSKSGETVILPIRFSTLGNLPYSIDGMLRQVQYAAGTSGSAASFTSDT